MDIGTKVIDIIAEQAILEPDDVTLESTLESLGIDSMGLVESIFAIEEAFDIQIPFNANEPSKSVFIIDNVSTAIVQYDKINKVHYIELLDVKGISIKNFESNLMNIVIKGIEKITKKKIKFLMSGVELPSYNPLSYRLNYQHHKSPNPQRDLI